MQRRQTVKRLHGALVLAVAGTLSAGVAPAAADTVTGEVVDLACYMHDTSMRGNAHKTCAATCLKKGLPIGLLTDDKQVFLILENHDNPKPYAALKDKAAQTVTVEGTKVTQGGVQGLIVEEVK